MNHLKRDKYFEYELIKLIRKGDSVAFIGFETF